jgi:hypothetical protein
MWQYGYSQVKISTSTGRVIEWDNTRGNLKVELRPGRNVTAASSFTRGSHGDDVLRLQGTPSDINRYPALGYEAWQYGYSQVKISTSTGRVIDISNPAGLSASINAPEVERRAMYHQTVDDVTLYYDQDMAYTGVYSYEESDGERIYGVARDGASYLYDGEFQPLGVRVSRSDDGLGFERVRVASGGDVDISLVEADFGALAFTSGSLSGTTMRLGDFDFYNLVSSDGASFSGSSTNIGDFSFDHLYSSEGTTIDGSRIRIGDTSFGNWSTSSGTSLSGTSQRIGDFEFHNYRSSDGGVTTGTTIRIGEFEFTNLRCCGDR